MNLQNLLLEKCVAKKIPVICGFTLMNIDSEKRSIQFCDKTKGGSLKTIDCSQKNHRIICCDGNSSTARTILEHENPGIKCNTQSWERDFRFLTVGFDLSNPQEHGLNPNTYYMFDGHSVFAASDSSSDKLLWVIGLSIDGCKAGIISNTCNSLLSKEATAENIQYLKSFIAKNIPRAVPLLENYKWSDYFKSKPYLGMYKYSISYWCCTQHPSKCYQNHVI